MRDAETKTIDDVTFEVTPLGFKAARGAFVRLTKTIGPALAHGAGGAKDVDMGAVLSALAENVSDPDLEWFAETFGKTTKFSTDGERWPYLRSAEREVLFGGRLMLFFRWLAFALEVNFSDFLEFMSSGMVGAVPAESP